MSESTIKSARTLSVVDATVRTISDHIANGRFVAGQRLPEVDLRMQLGVSKTVLREAFAKLQHEGLIEIQHFKGATVRRISMEEMLQMIEVMNVVMAHAMSKAATTIKAHPERATEVRIIREKLAKLAPRNQREHLDAFYEMMDIIGDLTGNPYLVNLIAREHSPLAREFLLDAIDFKPAVVEHTRKVAAVLELVENGEPDSAFDSFRKWTKLDLSWIRPEYLTDNK